MKSNHLFAIPARFSIGVTGELIRLDNFCTVRTRYARHCRDIKTTADLLCTLRAGAYAWPGGYSIFFVTADGAALSFNSVCENLRQICADIRENDSHSGWRVVATQTTAETDEPIFCDHSGAEIV